MKYEKIEKVSAVDQVAEQIKDGIMDEEWPVGAKLPSESELASTFGVNRLTVRMALQKLNTLGITETQVGSGTFVKEFNLNEHIHTIAEFYATPDMLKHVYNFRRIVEIECMKLAMKEGSKEEFCELQSRVEKYERSQERYFDILKDESMPDSKRDRQMYYQAVLDLDIHSYIVEMSHNQLLINAYSLSRETILQYLVELNRRRYEANKVTAGDGHTRLYKAMESGDIITATALYLDMIDHNIMQL